MAGPIYFEPQFGQGLQSVSDLYPLPVTSSGGSITSTGNTSTVALAGGATFTGTGELNSQSDVMVSCQSDASGTLYFDFSVNGTDWTVFPPTGFAVTANIHEFHVAVKGPRYFRVRLVNGAGAQSYLRLYTYYGTFRQGNAPVNFSIADDADAIVVKSVISGIGDTTAKVTDHQSLQVSPSPESKAAFGEPIAVSPTPIIQIYFPYNIPPTLVESRANQSGTVTQANRLAVMSTGAAANSSAEIRSTRPIKYNPGQGVSARFTAVFTTGVTGNDQKAGIGNESDGLYFGYQGETFGIFHERDGSPEIRTLTVTTASTTAENITITLDGDADATVAVTNSGDITTTVNEIAAHDYSDVGRGWTAYAAGNKVEFVSWDAATHSGTYSLSGATTAVGTFAQNVAGSAVTSSFIAQSSWNGADKFDGTGVTGVTLDPTKGNVYQVKYQWLGFGILTFYVEDPDDGEFHLVHSIEYANANTTTSLGDPSLSMRVISENTSNTSDVTVKTASMAAFIEGNQAYIGSREGVRSTKTDVTTALRPILSVRQRMHTNSLAIHTFTKILRLALSVEHTKPVQVVVILNGTLTGASFTALAGGTAEYDTSATAISGGTQLFSVPLGKSGDAVIDSITDYEEGILAPGALITFAAITASGTGAEANVSVELLERL